MGLDDLQSDSEDYPGSPTSMSAMNPKQSQPFSPVSIQSKSSGGGDQHDKQHQGDAERTTTNVGTPPGHVNPRGVGDARRPFPNIRRWARKGSHEKVQEEKESYGRPKATLKKWMRFGKIKEQGKGRNKKQVVKSTSMSAVDDPCDDFVGLTDVLEVWFVGGHGSECFAIVIQFMIIKRNADVLDGWLLDVGES